ncbi:hypothetical protein H0H92_010185 [Tricholoma furcatifolium]|nr:hypothetical protein H0H92_010185 [Tricholoma furcatifolium]
MVSKRRYLKVAAARAREQALLTRKNPSLIEEPAMLLPIVIPSDSETETAYQGGVNHYGTTSDDETDSQYEKRDGYETVDDFSEEEVAAMKKKMGYEYIQGLTSVKGKGCLCSEL